MADMRSKTTRGIAALALAAAGVAAAQAVAGADPATHQVTYTLTAAGPSDFTVTYLTVQPASKAAYNSDAYAYMKRENVNVGPGAPWTFTTTLNDPQWAFLQVSSTTHGGQAAPEAHCEVAIDGQVVNAQDAPYSPQCFMSRW